LFVVVDVGLHLNKNTNNNKSIPPMIRWDNFSWNVLFWIIKY